MKESWLHQKNHWQAVHFYKIMKFYQRHPSSSNDAMSKKPGSNISWTEDKRRRSRVGFSTPDAAWLLDTDMSSSERLVLVYLNDLFWWSPCPYLECIFNKKFECVNSKVVHSGIRIISNPTEFDCYWDLIMQMMWIESRPCSDGDEVVEMMVAWTVKSNMWGSTSLT